MNHRICQKLSIFSEKIKILMEHIFIICFLVLIFICCGNSYNVEATYFISSLNVTGNGE